MLTLFFLLFLNNEQGAVYVNNNAQVLLYLHYHNLIMGYMEKSRYFSVNLITKFYYGVIVFSIICSIVIACQAGLVNFFWTKHAKGDVFDSQDNKGYTWDS